MQTPFKHSYNLHTSKGQVIENVFGWIIRPGYVYGAYAQEAYFMIDIQAKTVTHFSSLGEFNMALREKKIQRYNMNDEENISHLIYQGGRNRKYR